MRKYLISAVLLSVLMLGFTACGGDDETPEPNNTPQNQQGNQQKGGTEQGGNEQGEEPEPEPAPQSGSAGTETFTVKGVQFVMVGVEGGTFQMGSNDVTDAQPIHEVKLDSYAIGQTEVTQELWEAVMGTNPSCFSGSKLPVERVSWNDCQTFINELNTLTGRTFRLPTEAEWEFAARGGTKSQGYTYSGSNILNDVAWYLENNSSNTHEVATKAANELGLYDMSGNVWEWCQDWYSSTYYSSSVINNPTGPSSGSRCVNRGGAWDGEDAYCCVAFRGSLPPDEGYYYLGFRLAL